MELVSVVLPHEEYSSESAPARVLQPECSSARDRDPSHTYNSVVNQQRLVTHHKNKKYKNILIDHNNFFF